MLQAWITLPIIRETSGTSTLQSGVKRLIGKRPIHLSAAGNGSAPEIRAARERNPYV